MPSGSERELVDRCLRAEPGAWDQLFDLHYAAAGRFVFQLMPDLSREDVEEICQETFLAVVRHLVSFDGRSRLQTWVLRIASNKARDFHERKRAAKRGGGRTPASLDAPDPVTGMAPDPPSSAPGPDESMISREQIQLLRESLDEVPGPCREIIELRYFGDLSYEEIGQALRLNLKTVSSRLSKCLDKLELVFRDRTIRENSTTTAV